MDYERENVLSTQYSVGLLHILSYHYPIPELSTQVFIVRACEVEGSGSESQFQYNFCIPRLLVVGFYKGERKGEKRGRRGREGGRGKGMETQRLSVQPKIDFLSSKLGS